MGLFLVNIVVYVGKHSIFRCLPNVQVYDASCWICNHFFSFHDVPSLVHWVNSFPTHMFTFVYKYLLMTCMHVKSIVAIRVSSFWIGVQLTWMIVNKTCSFMLFGCHCVHFLSQASKHCCYLLIFLHICCLEAWSKNFPAFPFA